MAELPSLCSPYPLTDAQVEDVRTKGHILLHDVLSPEEIEAYFPLVREFMRRWRETNDPQEKIKGDPHSSDLWTLADAPEAVTHFVTAPRLGEIAARLLGVDAVRLLFFNSFIKLPGSSGTLLHQDIIYMPLDTDKAVVVWIPLMDVSPAMGGLVFAQGSHQHGLLKPVDAKRFPIVRNGAMRPGDVSIHTCWTIHGTVKNSTETMREAIGVCYYADGARIDAPAGRIFDRIFMTRFFAGLGPGDIAAGPITPVVFRRNGT
jgi:hypothetical protein